MKGTVAASLSLFRRDLLPLKLPMGNAGDDSPRRTAALLAHRAAPREEVQSAPSKSEEAERGAAQPETGGKSGLALWRNSLAILREDLGLGSRS